VADAILDACARRGGVEYLAGLPDELFVRLLVRILPKQVDVASRDELSISIRNGDMEMDRERQIQALNAALDSARLGWLRDPPVALMGGDKENK